VFVDHTGEDQVGKTLVFYFKEAVARSARYSMDYSDYKLGDKFVSLEVVSVKDTASDAVSAVSVVAHHSSGGCQVSCVHQVMSLGALRVQETGPELLANIDSKCSE